MSLINPENDLAVMAAIFVLAGLSFLAERTRWGAIVTGTVIVIVVAIVAANLNLIPHQSRAYDFVFTYLVPTLIPLFLFQADIRRIATESGRMLLAFAIAVLGTLLGVIAALLLLDLSNLAPSLGVDGATVEAAIGGLFASTYIGGSVNYAALGEVTGLAKDPTFFSAATAADQLFGALYLILLSALPAMRWLAGRFPESDHATDSAADRISPRASAMSLTLALAVALTIVAISDAIVDSLDIPGLRYVVITAMTLALATCIPMLHERLAGSFDVGVGLAFVFFAAIAAQADVTAMVDVAPLLVVLVLILLGTHALVLLLVGRVFSLSLPELITASNAAVLGATTAPALAAARGWNALVTPGVLVGVLGYALGTFIGTALFRLWP